VHVEEITNLVKNVMKQIIAKKASNVVNDVIFGGSTGVMAEAA
jgi:hypothetical protein